MKELPKTYNPSEVEDRIYAEWEAEGLFNPDTVKHHGKSFSIVLPPPNATGTLHLGHASMLAIEDVMVRYKRMRGFDTLWVPGTDHASIATQNVVEKKLWKEEKKTRHDFPRDEFLEKVSQFAEESKGTIRNQLRKMGSSLDWSREAYTLDETRSRAVRKVFKMMYDDGLIYRGYRIVNWCPRCLSTLADDEVEHKESAAKLYFFKYDASFPITIATTRPETKLGDTAVMVNPSDDRYRQYIGQTFTVDFIGQQLTIKVIADPAVDITFGTGAVGVTPAHSLVDAEIAQRYQLPTIKVIDESGKITHAAPAFEGLPVAVAREKIIALLEEKGLMERMDDITNNVSTCYRCKTVVEPLPSEQWFVNVDKKVERLGMSLKEKAIAVVKGREIEIIPDRFEKVYINWMEILHDWCISRQIWFGHRIPVWYCDECKAVTVSETDVETCSSCHSAKIHQDQDTLDTWFSSGTWTFSTLLDENFKDFSKAHNPDLARFHPTAVLETGYDIIFFWVARMILMTTYVMDEVPFRQVYLHGIVRDKFGQKMSKSRPETSIDPIEVGTKYGYDAVRLSLLIGSSAGNDQKLYDEKIAGYRNFVNKLWNVSRYINMILPDGEVGSVKPKTLADEWILSRFNHVKANVSSLLDQYNFSQAGQLLFDFTTAELADWYLEIAKVEKDKEGILKLILVDLLKLWHPFTPFVTTAIWQEMGLEGHLMVSDWPEIDESAINPEVEASFGMLQEVVTKIRNVRAAYSVPPGQFVTIAFKTKNKKLIGAQEVLLKQLARIEQYSFVTEKPDNSAGAVVGDMEVFVSLVGLIDVEKEKARLEKELANVMQYISAQETKLSKESFVQNAPGAVVELERQKLVDAIAKRDSLHEQVVGLG